MKQTKILVIDDSATIRRLVDTELSAAGYQVLLSPTAEDGVERAAAELPDLILLDHQLPGTTGFDVCCQLLEHGELSSIPVVISSTLRKKAYVEYVDAHNVVDMLPKPYTSELLLTTVENAINTAKMVVQSQAAGSAVPETIDEQAEADLFGTFEHFGVREIIDLVNCGSKCGLLEVQSGNHRILVYMDRGRIQAVTAQGIEAAEVARFMPESLSELAPVIKVSVAGRKSSAVDSLVDLLDNKLLDPRLLRKLLRLQAAVLVRKCFTEPVQSFRFEGGATAPPLFAKLPLEISLVALLCEGAMIADLADLPAIDDQIEFVRRTVRGQNLDRAGLTGSQMKLMGQLSSAVTLDQLAHRCGEDREQVYRVLCGFEQAELVERRAVRNSTQVVAVTASPAQVAQFKTIFANHQDQVVGKVVSDWLALGLLLRRRSPDVLFVDLDEDFPARLAKLQQNPAFAEAPPRMIGILTPANAELEFPEQALEVFSDVIQAEQVERKLADLISSETGHDPNESQPSAVLPTADVVPAPVENVLT